MSEEEKDRRDLATNRLLDLLRAQQAQEREEAKEKEPEVEEKKGKKKAILTSSQPDVSLTEPSTTPEVVETAEEKKEERAEKSLLESLAKIQSSQVPPEEETGVAESPKEGEKEVEVVEPPPSDLLQQIQKETTEVKEPEEVEVEPAEFDSSLISMPPKKKRKPVFKDYFNTVFHILNESQKRFCIHRGDNFLRYLQLHLSPKGTKIDKFSYYTLPYDVNGKTISDMDDLLKFVLKNEVKGKGRKRAFGSYFDSNLSTKTQILQTPKLKQKELIDLIEWNAKKNLPFGSDQATSNWEITEAVRNPDKQHVVIGVGKKDSLEKAIDDFKNQHVRLRLYTTLPILLWKLFVKNYPEKNEGCYVLVHIGEKHTTLVVIEDHKLLFTREVSVGAEDFYKAVMQRIVVGNESIEIDYPQAKQILRDYGFPKNGRGVIRNLKISLYKISIFLRPVVERMTNELSRSLTYFKKQSPELEWEWILFDGIGATFPYLLTTIGENLDLKVGILNPIRDMNYSYSDGQVLPEKLLPNYTLNFALASEEAEKINILPKKYQSNFKFIFLSKIVALMGIVFIPFFIVKNIYSYQTINELDKQIHDLTKKWESLSVRAQEYFEIVNETEILSGFLQFLSNDRTYSTNQIKLLKLFSSVVPSDVKLTSVIFKKEVVETEKEADENRPQEFKDFLQIRGFVQADASVADIQFTNFLMQLEQLQIFTKVEPELEEHSEPQEGKLFFTLKLWY